ncbi:MAG: hypothetical protein WAT66_05135 [Actinomycetota bacterium]
MTAGAVAFVLLASAAAASPADTKEKIADAKRRLAALQASIASRQKDIASMQRSMRTLAGAVASHRRGYAQIRSALASTKARIVDNEARYQTLRGLIDAAAADAYTRGQTYVIEAVLDSESMSDAADVMSYSRAITRRNLELIDQARMIGAQLAQQKRRESELADQSRAALTRLSDEQAELFTAFADSQTKLAGLARDRVQLGTLLMRLRSQLRAEELAAAFAAANGGTPISFGRWAEAFLEYIHVPVARNNLVVMVAWQWAEYTDARWNPLATTYPMPGSTSFNSHGVRNYASLKQGLEATTRTLRHAGYGYEAILANLARNADPMTTARAINESRWCRGCADGEYVIGLIDAVEKYYDDYASKRG